MRPPPLFRALTPLGWGAGLLVVCAMLGLVGHGLGLRWDPFDLAGRRLRAAESRAATAESQVVVRRLEARGREEQQRRLDLHHRTAISAATILERAESQARSAHDASIPLDSARLARLREHDRRLCDAAPAVCTAAEADPAAGGGDAVPAGPAA